LRNNDISRSNFSLTEFECNILTHRKIYPMNVPNLPIRKSDSHKGDYGRAVLLGGSRGMSGAIALAGMAALRAGAGLVRLGVPDSCLETIASFEPCYTTIPLPDDAAGRFTTPAALLETCSPATAVAFGPGVGRSADLDTIAETLYTQLPQPLVIDADGLNALAARTQPLVAPGGPRVLTPHPGEFMRLAHTTEKLSWEQQASRAERMAAEFEVVIVLKGHRSLITDGSRSERNTTGNPGMATGGSGDVLTGVIIALICQGLTPFDAAHLGCHVHGLAGDLAAAELGEVSLTAKDLVAYLPAAFKQLCHS
jgi:NAD(P)H-hydrate epimerase